MELNSISQSDFVKLASVIWVRGLNSVANHMKDSGLVKVRDIPEHTGNTREFSEVDTNEYLTFKGQGDQAARGKIQQGLKNSIALVKSSLINGETLIAKAKTTLSKLVRQTKNSLMIQLQRLSEKTAFIAEATVWTV